MKTTKKMDHTNYPKHLRTLPMESLNFISKDAREALEANPNGENASYYADEICYVANEKARREKSNYVPDEQNPDFIFNTTHVGLLLDAANGKLDLLKLAKKELASRGLNEGGAWVGFSAAKKIWKNN